MLYRILFFLFFPLAGYCQNTIGIPDVINYYKGAYKAGLQNWDIKQDSNGIIYVANNEGLLSFDGKYWKLYPLPNKTIVRSVEIGVDNKIYVGGQDELGYFIPGDNGSLEYYSLTGILSEKDRSFGDVWDIISLKNDIFVRTLSKMFKISGKDAVVYNAKSAWAFLGVVNNKIFAQDFANGLLSFENSVWNQHSAGSHVMANVDITAMIPMKNDSILITTLKNGIFSLSQHNISKIISPNNGLFEKERIYAAKTIHANWLALATTYGGIYIIDLKGNLIQSFSKPEGVQNNNVLSLFLDKQSNLWLGLDNGIDCIAYNSAIKRINPSVQDGAGYTSIIHNNYLYSGTSVGLFSVPLESIKDLSFSKGKFLPVANATGQIWGLTEINGKILLGQHEGAFIVNKNTATPIYSNVGFWNFTPLSAVFPANKIVAGYYNGLKFFNYNNQTFTEAQNFPDFIESSRFVAIDKNDHIWVSHPYHGVYKMVSLADGKYKKQIYTSKNGLPSTLNNHVYKIKNEVLVATEKGIYQYNETKDSFEPSEFYQKLLGQQSLRYLKEDKQGNIWFIHEKSLGVLDLTNKDTTIVYLPELNNKMLSGFDFIYPVNENNIFIGGEKGFFHINYEKYKKNVPALQVQIRKVRIVNKTDSLLFGGYFAPVNEQQIQEKKNIPDITNNWKMIHIEFSAPVYGEQSNLEYCYRLSGFDLNWSEWSVKTEKEYTNLPSGKYTFEVKVRNNLGNESAPVKYIFKILPPWYLTYWAKTVYFLLFIVGIFFLYQWLLKKFHSQQTKYEEEQKRLQYLHKLEINKAENELIALRNEKLQLEIDFKNSELATSAMHLVQRGEILTKLKTELNHMMKALNNDKATLEMKKIIKVISEDDNMAKDWENFTKHFDKVQSDFIVELKEKHPSITGNELKLCAYLRMNLSTKEIAQLMNISVRGVEISRYRLRKKLLIASETSLFDYLIKIQSKNL